MSDMEKTFDGEEARDGAPKKGCGKGAWIALGVVLVVIAAVVVCVVVLSKPSEKEEEFEGEAGLRMLTSDEVTTYNARCLDGTAYAFYTSLNTSSTEWVIYLQGGGVCWDAASCASRLQTELGSSNAFPPEMGLGDLQSNNPAKNPQFATWNKVYLNYCSGDLHTGQRTAKRDGLYFSGHNNVNAVIQILKAESNLDSATSLVLTGSSAGALGSLSNADFVKGLLPASTRMAVVMNGGWFISSPTWENKLPTLRQRSLTYFTNFNSYVDQSCAAAISEDADCITGNWTFPYLETPLFVVQADYDSDALFTRNGCPDDTSQAGVCTFINQFGKLTIATLQQVKDSAKSGLFLASCLEHVVGKDVKLSDKNWVQAVNDWWAVGGGTPAGPSSPVHLFDTCDPSGMIPCNPTCPSMKNVCSASA